MTHIGSPRARNIRGRRQQRPRDSGPVPRVFFWQLLVGHCLYWRSWCLRVFKSLCTLRVKYDNVCPQAHLSETLWGKINKPHLVSVTPTYPAIYDAAARRVKIIAYLFCTTSSKKGNLASGGALGWWGVDSAGRSPNTWRPLCLGGGPSLAELARGTWHPGG